jgi:hypothetical protein
MITKALRPRGDQVEELTRGQHLPLDPIAQAHLDIIFETVARVWDELRRDQFQVVAEGTEAEINAMLEARLNGLWRTDPLWSQLVSSVARGKESLSFDGSHLEKRPDLSIYLTGKHPSFPIVVECKLIDHFSGKGVDLYCKNGVARFVAGQYAWANREAVMIAYIRDDSTVEKHLSPFLESGAGKALDPWQTCRLPEIGGGRTPVTSSDHLRNFEYSLATGPKGPGMISLWHLWLGASRPVVAAD